jgi:hypothetical protein
MDARETGWTLKAVVLPARYNFFYFIEHRSSRTAA